jgi:dUTP pyrophosphatase
MHRHPSGGRCDVTDQPTGPAFEMPNFEMMVLDPRVHEWGLPGFQTDMSAGIDLYACIDAPLEIRPQADAVLIPSGIAILMNDPNMVAFLLARSGLGHKKGLILGQSVGTIDADYANQIFISAWLRTPPGSEPLTVHPGDRIAQLVFLPIVRPRFTVVDAFTATTQRGMGGFGSTGGHSGL